MKYWDKCCLALAIGVILDPRFKFRVVEYYYSEIYGLEEARPYIRRVREAFTNLYHEYNDFVGGTFDTDGGSYNSTNMGSSSSTNDKYSGFDKFCEKNPTIQRKLELEMYLEEPRFLRTKDFCILHWWKVHTAKYPILAKIVRDVLALPATTNCIRVVV